MADRAGPDEAGPSPSKASAMTSPTPIRVFALIVSIAAILSGCATAPKGVSGSLIASDVRLEVERDRPQSSRQQRIDRAAIAQAKTLHVAPPRFADGADTALSPREREVMGAQIDHQRNRDSQPYERR